MRTPLRLAALAALVPLIALTVACSGDDAKPSTSPAVTVSLDHTPPPGLDVARAKTILLTTPDLPDDYLERRRAPDAAKTAYLSCAEDTTDGVSGIADSDEWLFDGESPAVSETVRVYTTEADATRRADATAAHVACLVDAVNAGKLDGDGSALSGGASTPLSIDVGADQVAAFQVEAMVGHAGQDAAGTAQYTIAAVRDGRVVCEILVRGSGAPIPSDELADIVQSAANRITQ